MGVLITKISSSSSTEEKIFWCVYFMAKYGTILQHTEGYVAFGKRVLSTIFVVVVVSAAENIVPFDLSD